MNTQDVLALSPATGIVGEFITHRVAGDPANDCSLALLPMKFITLVLCSLAVVAAGCQPNNADLLLYCGAGLRPPVAELAAEFERRHGIKVECNYRGSEILLGTIKVARRGDLYMPGDVHYLELADKEGLIASSKTVCFFEPVILVQKGNPMHIATLESLTKPGVRLGLGVEKACAIGKKAEKIFAKNNIAKETYEKNVVSRLETVNGLGDNVKLKHLDAAIVWKAVAEQYVDATDYVAIPVEDNVISTVPVGVLTCSKQSELAEQFAEFVTSDEGKKVFAKHRYTIDPPKTTP